jgi:hypothetical protein
VADKRTASLWCQAIREAATPYTSSEILLDVDKEFGTNTKSLWGKIFDLLPIYAIFKADRESSDGDSEAKNSLQQAVKDARLRCRTKLQHLKRIFRIVFLMSHRERWINYVKWHQNLPVNLLRDLRRNPSGPSISPLMGKMESPSISEVVG